jgi:hypothetical protein
MAAMAKKALTAICLFTLGATAFLSASLLILRPPRANYAHWTFVASVIVMQDALTLIALRVSSSHALRYAAAAGSVVIVALGAFSVYSTVSGPHFEGYALVLGAALVVQGLLTLFSFAAVRKGVVGAGSKLTGP